MKSSQMWLRVVRWVSGLKLVWLQEMKLCLKVQIKVCTEQRSLTNLNPNIMQVSGSIFDSKSSHSDIPVMTELRIFGFWLPAVMDLATLADHQ